MISFKQRGNFHHAEDFFRKSGKLDYTNLLIRYGKEGVDALASATPVDTGLTSKCWDYKITKTKGSIKIDWFNSNIVNGVNIAVILQYGHGTRNGGYVQGRDYINPAIRSTFDRIVEEAWKVATK